MDLPRDVVKGVNISHPSLFQHNGSWYYFVALISNPDVSIGVKQLDNAYIDLFEYTNEINSLCLYGRIVYTDVDGEISKFFNRQDNHVEIGVRQMEKVSDAGGTSVKPSLEAFEEAKRSDGATTFAHRFIVQNMRIVSRNKQNIKYEITLVSVAWYLLCAEINFSNYPLSEPPSDKKPRNGYLMLRNFLTEAFSPPLVKDSFKIDTDSFESCANETMDLEIPFITNGNDNCFSVMKYIFNKMYWSKQQMNKTFKFITFTPNTCSYKCIDYSKDLMYVKCEKPFVILSMFETDYEQQMYSSNNQIASTAAKNATSTYEDRFEQKIWGLDQTTNTWALSSNTLEEKDIANLYNSKPNALKEISNASTSEKYMLNIRPEFFQRTGHYHHQHVEWNRSYSLYQSLIDNLMKRDALIINTDGDLTHQPGICMGLVLDRTLEKVPEMTAEQRKELYEKHKQIESLFPVLKVTHQYFVSRSAYKENVLLARNYILDARKV